MLVKLGARSRPQDLLSLFLECHQRIRFFTTLAERAGRDPAIDDAERSEACQRAHRYFTVALPLHMKDEEESLLPRLRGRDTELDAAMRAMHDEHHEQEPMLAELSQLLRAVAAQPRDLALRARLAASAASLGSAMHHHLVAEEQVIFPKIAEWLDAAERDAVIAELRARRTEALG